MINKNPNIILIGFGSIGRRHFQNLTALGFRSISVFDPDPQVVIPKHVVRLKRLTLKSLQLFDIAFICSPTNRHMRHALIAAQAGCHLFIEKPLSHSLSGIKKLEKVVRAKRLVTLVGCNMRFHPALDFIKEYLRRKKLGSIYSINLEFGHFLPDWRPGFDYRKGYAMRKRTGGGILLDDIHEYDLMFWLLDFPKVRRSHIMKAKLTDLTIDTEDYALGQFEFEGRIVGMVSSDYLSKRYRRNLTVKGARGTLRWDFKEGSVWHDDHKRIHKIFSPEKFDVNEMYISEIRHFLSCVARVKSTDNDITRARALLVILGVR